MSLQNRPDQSHLVLTERLPSLERYLSLQDTLAHQVDVLLKAWQAGHPDVPTLLRSHGLASGSKKEALRVSPSLERTRTLIAREHGFRDWEEVVEASELKIDSRFETAADAVVAGDLDSLQTILRETPELACARSSYPHHATLLHHCAANGIEHTRQWQSPANAPDIARALLVAGAEPDALCDVYDRGSGTTTLCLLVSSSHPAVAGVQSDVVEVLCRGGANPNGIDDDGLPLWTALTFGYARAAERLALCGVRVDNIIFAAALGKLDLVKSQVAAGRATMASARSGRSIGLRGPALAPEQMLEYALIYASRHGRRDVVAFLLDQAPDLAVKEPQWGSSALGMARHSTDNVPADDRQAIIELLENRAAGRGTANAGKG